MKINLLKVLSILIVGAVCAIGPVHASTTYEVETDQGIQQVVIPDGMSEIDVLLYLAKSYYNLYYDYEELKSQADTLTNQVSSYISSNQELRVKYEDLLSSYEELSSLYKKSLKPQTLKASIGANIDFNLPLNLSRVNLTAGAFLFEKFNIFAIVGYNIIEPHSLNYGIGFEIIF